MYKYIAGGILTFIGAALELMMQVSSHDAAANACTYLAHYWPDCGQLLPDWFSTHAHLLPATLFFSGLIILFWAPIRALKRRLSFEHRFVALHEAAAKIYGEIRGTDLARFTEGLTDTPNQILDSIGNQILHNVPVQVRRAPSPKWELFPKSKITQMGACDGATGIKYWGDNQPFYIDPKVSRGDLRRLIRHLKKDANFVSEWSKDLPTKTELAIQFDPDNIKECSLDEGKGWRQLRLKITNGTGKTIHDCHGDIDSVESALLPDSWVEKAPLTWAFLIDITKLDLHRGESKILNAIQINDAKNGGSASVQFISPANANNPAPPFEKIGKYECALVVSAEEINSRIVRFDFFWTGNSRTSRIKNVRIS
jgi:hypothetical protein